MDDIGFSVGVVSLSWFVPIIASGTCVSPLDGLAVRRLFQGPWRGHACIGLGRRKWRFSSFNGTDTPAGYVPLRPHKAPLTPNVDATSKNSELCNIFLHYLINGTILETKLLHIKVCIFTLLCIYIVYIFQTTQLYNKSIGYSDMFRLKKLSSGLA